MCHFVREADDSGIFEEFLKNSERNLAKSKPEIAYEPAYNNSDVTVMPHDGRWH